MDQSQKEFAKIIEKYGYKRCSDQRWLRALLRDRLSAQPRQINALADAASEGLPGELAQLSNDPHRTLKHAQLKKRLIENRGWQDELATWTIAGWGAAVHSSSENGKSFSLKCPACGRARSLAGIMIGEVVPCGNAGCAANLRVFAEGRCIAVESEIEEESSPTILVATDGSGQYASLSEAINKAPEGTRIELRGGPFEGVFVITRPTVIAAVDPMSQVVVHSSVGTCFLLRSGSLRLENLSLEMRSTVTGARKPVLEVINGEAQLEHCALRSSVGETVKIHGEGSRVRFNHCSFHSHRGAAVVIFDHAKSSFTGCSIIDNRGTGISIDAGAEVNLAACRIEGAGASAITSRRSELQIDDCRITGSKDYGIDISGGTLQAIRSTVTGNGLRGVWLRNNVDGRIEGCDLRGNRRGSISPLVDSHVALRDNLEA